MSSTIVRRLKSQPGITQQFPLLFLHKLHSIRFIKYLSELELKKPEYMRFVIVNH